MMTSGLFFMERGFRGLGRFTRNFKSSHHKEHKDSQSKKQIFALVLLRDLCGENILRYSHLKICTIRQKTGSEYLAF